MSGAPSGPGTARSSDLTLGLGGISMLASICDTVARRWTMSGMVLKPPGIASCSRSRGSSTSGSMRSRRDMNPPRWGLTQNASFAVISPHQGPGEVNGSRSGDPAVEELLGERAELHVRALAVGQHRVDPRPGAADRGDPVQGVLA